MKLQIRGFDVETVPGERGGIDILITPRRLSPWYWLWVVRAILKAWFR